MVVLEYRVIQPVQPAQQTDEALPNLILEHVDQNKDRAPERCDANHNRENHQQNGHAIQRDGFCACWVAVGRLVGLLNSKSRVTDRDGLARFCDLALYGDAVDLGSVRGAEVGDLYALRRGLDAGVAAGDLSVEAEGDGARLSADLDRAVDGEGLPGERAVRCS